MPFTMLRSYFPELAEEETRSFTVLNDERIPPGSYGLIESYCDEPDCDCRRVFLLVFSSHSKRMEAVISYGWESAKFYAQWMGTEDAELIEELRGPVLNRLSPQSPLAPAILETVRDVILQDQAYVERLKRHYRLFRDHLGMNPKGKMLTGFKNRKQIKRGKLR